MPTTNNRKKEALSIEEMKRKFPNGVIVHDCKEGFCLISGKRPGESWESETPNDLWWADASSVIGEITPAGEYNFFTPQKIDLAQKLDKVTIELNSKIFNVQLRRRVHTW
ncbi:MAG: hypothetical protein WC460_05195 [Patescibacteria group bacterium]